MLGLVQDAKRLVCQQLLGNVYHDLRFIQQLHADLVLLLERRLLYLLAVFYSYDNIRRFSGLHVFARSRD